MAAIDVFKSISKEFAYEVPDIVVSSTLREFVEMRDLSEKASDELARRVDWRKLRRETTISGVGLATIHTLPFDFSRLIQGASVVFNGEPLRGSLTDDEWAILPVSVGTPRYFRISTDKIEFWPAVPLSQTVKIFYQSKYWNTTSARWVADTDDALLDEELIVKGTLVRLRRLKGLDFADHLAEYEAALADIAGFESGVRSP